MKKQSYVLLLAGISCFCSLRVFAQSMGWHAEVKPTPIQQLHTRKLNVLGDAQVEYATAGPDKRIYSTGFYTATRANFGAISIDADTMVGKPYLTDTVNGYLWGTLYSSFVACQDSSGNFLWARSLSSSAGYFSYWSMSGWNNSGNNSG